ncbi:MAG: HlyD family efflux transporter periplasmic adaptor subunit [Planctomycetota bacterium]
MDTLAPTTIQSLDLSAKEEVGHSHAGRILAIAVAGILVILPIVLVFVQWQQNVPGAGYVSAVDPLDRARTIPAPVQGRLVKLHVQEGARVREGDILVEMADLDPNFSDRLKQRLDFARDELARAHDTLESLDRQLIQLEEERAAAVKVAQAELKAAIDKVREARGKLRGEEARLAQLKPNYDRTKRLHEKGTKSELELQIAEAAYESAKADVAAANATVDVALSDEEAKAEKITQVGADKLARIDQLKADIQEAGGKLNQVKAKVTEAETDFDRQSTQKVRAPRDGTVLLIHGANNSDLIDRGAPLIEFVPDVDELAVEFWMRGIDAPLVSPGRKARLQFEGWPAVQFAGWPSVAVGTFGGIVLFSDAQARPDGKVRVLIAPDPDDEPWPDPPFLRQGVRTNGWVQLETVSVGYEIWRQLNAFPPTIQTVPTSADGGGMNSKGTNGNGKKGESP